MRSAGGGEHPPADGAGDQVDADQIGDVARAGVRRHFGERARLHYATGVENGDAISERVGVDGIVSDEDAHAVERREVASQVAPNSAACARVERCERLVEQQQARVGGQGTGKRGALRLAAGKCLRALVGVLRQPDPLDPVRCTPAGGGLRRTAGTQPIGDVLEHRHVFEQDIVLEDEADGPGLGFDEDVGDRIVEDGLVKGDVAGIDRGETGEATKHRALAGAVRAEERQ